MESQDLRWRRSETENVVFDGPFPEKSALNINIPPDIKDFSGRALANANKFPLAVKTDRYPALAKFPEKFGVIESKEGALLPVTVRNIEEEIKTWLERADKERDRAGRHEQVPRKPEEKKPAAQPAGGITAARREISTRPRREATRRS